ncbi:hypothetical protein KZX70_16615 [Paenibacillus silvae]|uniref:hypothetical protein n=1 Tax=Paenibacillus silvae TaxID=1325358 RepID=UPI001667B635|nr:hypothetical protein [Paenibacillus silvae]MCK6076482.1 hypothetical protein [Paenibacillus silvae]MCK6150909.1 hypothetical protein [Paenibacillus silvae]MCK6269169.1 hypothetical protein [Paenibacillus silvae]
MGHAISTVILTILGYTQYRSCSIGEVFKLVLLLYSDYDINVVMGVTGHTLM